MGTLHASWAVLSPARPSRVSSSTGAKRYLRLTELALDIVGPESVLSGSTAKKSFHSDAPSAERHRFLGRRLYNARAGTIYAKDSQVQRNILGEMVLGLRRSLVPSERDSRPDGADARAHGGPASRR